MKKKIIAISCVAILSILCASLIYAEVDYRSVQIDDGASFARTKCATEINTTGNGVLKCMPGGGCQWTAGSAVVWGGKC